MRRHRPVYQAPANVSDGIRVPIGADQDPVIMQFNGLSGLGKDRVVACGHRGHRGRFGFSDS